MRNAGNPNIKRIQEEDANLRQVQRREYQPEPIIYEDKAAFVLSRCVRGPIGWPGFFKVEQLVQAGKKIERRAIAEGVDMVVALASIEDALRKRVFR
jgi:hypothetical protein